MKRASKIRADRVHIGQVIQHPRFHWWGKVTGVNPRASIFSESNRTLGLSLLTGLSQTPVEYLFRPHQLLEVKVDNEK